MSWGMRLDFALRFQSAELVRMMRNERVTRVKPCTFSVSVVIRGNNARARSYHRLPANGLDKRVDDAGKCLGHHVSPADNSRVSLHASFPGLAGGFPETPVRTTTWMAESRRGTHIAGTRRAGSHRLARYNFEHSAISCMMSRDTSLHSVEHIVSDRQDE